ncbi:hypothetical protein Hanom_Chr14g01315941 [Helianthus anomalus]
MAARTLAKKTLSFSPCRLLSNNRNAKPGPVCESFYFETLAANENPRVLTIVTWFAVRSDTGTWYGIAIR